MRMTPLEIQHHRFRSAWRGVDAQEVEAFLQAVADDYEGLLREADSRSNEIRQLEMRVDDLSRNESLLKETLVSAQNLGDELRHTAERQAEMTVREAEIKAEKILDAAHRRAARLSEEIRELRGLRTRLAAALRSTMAAHGSMVDAICTDENEKAISEDERNESPAPPALALALATDDRKTWESPEVGIDSSATRPVHASGAASSKP